MLLAVEVRQERGSRENPRERLTKQPRAGVD